MTDKEKLEIMLDLSRLQIIIMNRFDTFVSEQVSRHRITKEDVENFKSGINFVMDEQFGFINRKLSEMK